MRAVKANKSYTIDETQKKHYQEAGFDIIDENGAVISYGRGKKVPYEEYAALKKKYNILMEKNASEADSNDDEEAVSILKAYAEEHGVDIGRSSSVAGIVKKIKEQMPEGSGQDV